MCFCCANNLKSLEPTTRLCPPLLRHLVVIVLFACVRYLVVLPFHAYLKRGINHFLLSLQLSMPILCVVWLVCFSYKPYFSQLKQVVCGMWESRDYIPAGHHQQGFVIKEKCHSAVCLRPCLRPDDREVTLIIGEGNKNSPHLIVVRYFARYKFLIIIIIFKPLALFLSSFLSLTVHQKWTNGTELSF